MVLSDELNIKRLTMYCRKHGLEESEYLLATHKRQAKFLLDLYQKNPAYESLRKESFDEFFKLPPCDQVYAHFFESEYRHIPILDVARKHFPDKKTSNLEKMVGKWSIYKIMEDKARKDAHENLEDVLIIDPEAMKERRVLSPKDESRYAEIVRKDATSRRGVVECATRDKITLAQAISKMFRCSKDVGNEVAKVWQSDNSFKSIRAVPEKGLATFVETNKSGKKISRHDRAMSVLEAAHKAGIPVTLYLQKVVGNTKSTAATTVSRYRKDFPDFVAREKELLASDKRVPYSRHDRAMAVLEEAHKAGMPVVVYLQKVVGNTKTTAATTASHYRKDFPDFVAREKELYSSDTPVAEAPAVVAETPEAPAVTCPTKPNTVDEILDLVDQCGKLGLKSAASAKAAIEAKRAADEARRNELNSLLEKLSAYDRPELEELKRELSSELSNI